MYQFLKRSLDIVFALSSLLLLTPLILLISLIIKIESGEPIMYKEIRIGKDGKKIDLYRFRTMVLFDQKHGIDNKQMTRIGSFLKRYNLDELPKYINVLKGDISLVGPWPLFPYEAEKLTDWQRKRQNAFPGLTGLWQISYTNWDFEDMIKVDLEYIEKRSLLFDFYILLKTMVIVVSGR